MYEQAKPGLWALAAGVVLGISGCGESSAPFVAAANELPAQLKAAKAEGFPLSLAALQGPKPPPDQDAAPLIARTLILYRENGDAIKVIQADYTPGQLHPLAKQLPSQAAIRALAHIRPLMLVIEAAADKPKLGYTVEGDLEQDREGMLNGINADAKLLAFQGRVEAAQKDYPQAAESLEQAWQLGLLAQQVPSSRGLMAGLTIQRQVMPELLRISFNANASPACLSAMEKVWANCPPAMSWRRSEKWGLLSNLLLLSQSDEDIAAYARSFTGSGTSEGNFIPAGIDSSTLRKAYASRLVAYYRKLNRLPEPSVSFSVEPYRAANQSEEDGDATHAFNRELALSRVYAFAIDAELERRMTGAALKLLAYRNAYGALPKKLIEAGCSITDPYSGKPIHYAVQGPNFYLYSVGPNGQDEGGRSAYAADDVAAFYPPNMAGIVNSG